MANLGNTIVNGNLKVNGDLTCASYTPPLATSGTRGGIQIGYSASGANIPLQLSSEKAYVTLTNTAIQSALTKDTTPTSASTNPITSGGVYTALASKLNTSGGTVSGTLTVTGALTANGGLTVEAGDVLQFNKINIPTSSSGNTYGTGSSGQVLKTNGTTVYWGDDNNTTYSDATTSSNGLMSATDKKTVVYFVEGTQTTATNVWTGTLSNVSALYDGLTIRYYLPYAGTSTGATLTLTLSGGTTTSAYPIYRYGRTTQITTHFGAGSIITLTYRSSYSVAGTTYTNAWLVDNFYDSNSYAYVRQYNCTESSSYNAEYPLLARRAVGDVTNYTTAYTNFATGVTLNPYSGTITASGGLYSGSALVATQEWTKSSLSAAVVGTSTTGGTFGTVRIAVVGTTGYIYTT